jgi:CRISPR/Cas system-associated exonuclease Cas4 (RecB family)
MTISTNPPTTSGGVQPRTRKGEFGPTPHDEVVLDDLLPESPVRPVKVQDRSNDRDLPDRVFRPGRDLPEHVSHSSLKDYSFCPASYALGRLDGARPETDSPSRAVGDATHKILDQISGGTGDEDAISAVCADPEFAGHEEAIRKMVAKCIAWEPANPNRPSVRETEVHIEANINGYPVVGEIDAVELDEDGSIVLSDYKTGKAPSPAGGSALADDVDTIVTELVYDAKVTRQVVLYAEMAEANGHHVDKVRMIYPAAERVVEVDLNTPRGELLRTEARRFVEYEGSRMAHSFNTGNFPAKPSENKCRSCDVARACPAAKAMATSPATTPVSIAA